MKEFELINRLKKRSINIAVITETKKKLKGTQDIDDFVMLYSGVPQNKRAACGVAILLDKTWKNKIVNYTFVNERMIIVRLKFERGYLSVFGVYAPENGRKEETDLFYEELQLRINNCKKNDSMILMGDLNARVGNQPIPNVVGTFGEICLNDNGKQLRDFASFNNFKLTNTFFRKKEINKYTWSARGTRSLIDYVIVNKKLSSQIMDTRVLRGYDIYSDHFLVISKIKLMTRWKRSKPKHNRPEEEVFRIPLLQEDSIRNVYQKRLNQLIREADSNDNVNEEWDNIKNLIQKAAYEALGKSRKKYRKNGLIIWNDDIEKAVKEKQMAFRNMLQNNTLETREIYKEKRNLAKRIIRNAHQESWDKFISVVENDVHGRQTLAYKILRKLNKEERDNAYINIIKTKEWIDHYRNLWYSPTAAIEFDIGTIDQDIDYSEMNELQEALKSIKNRKAVGTDNLNAPYVRPERTES
ncbi:uncharacterized protein LOC129218133 [Uloborus diversus]|uniref:uncharacterized protein LOC129218133 n=1 Tax=Uloborus diversus TaxID=327109 RepID=UPI002408F77C|nr:uncharacterized protein LOC129218133 [Uloborus diversus]